MSIYLISSIYIFCFFLIFLDFTNTLSMKLKKTVFDIVCVIIVLISSGKTEITSYDTKNYISYFNEISCLSELKYTLWGFEPGFVFLNGIIKSLGLEFHYLFFIISCISLSMYRQVIFSYSRYIFLSLFTYISCFFFLNEMIIIRFGLASAFVLYNIKYLTEKKYMKAFFCILIATSFHYTSIVGLIPIFVLRKKYLNSIFFVTLLFSLITLFFIIVNPFRLVIYLSSFANQNISDLLSRLIRYKDIESSAGFKKIVIYIFPFVMIIIGYFNRQREKDLTYRIFYVIYIYYLVSFFFMLTFNQVASLARLNSLFLPITIISYSYVLDSHKKQVYFKYLYVLFFILLNSYIFMRHIFFNSGGSINLV